MNSSGSIESPVQSISSVPSVLVRACGWIFFRLPQSGGRCCAGANWQILVSVAVAASQGGSCNFRAFYARNKHFWAAVADQRRPAHVNNRLRHWLKLVTRQQQHGTFRHDAVLDAPFAKVSTYSSPAVTVCHFPNVGCMPVVKLARVRSPLDRPASTL